MWHLSDHCMHATAASLRCRKIILAALLEPSDATQLLQSYCLYLSVRLDVPGESVCVSW